MAALSKSRSTRGNFTGSPRKRNDSGPARFSPAEKERSIEQQMQSLDATEMETIEYVKAMWQRKEQKVPGIPSLTDAHLLRYARSHSFHQKRTWNHVQNYDVPEVQRSLNLKAASMAEQLRKKTLFPLPGLKTRAGDDVFYMKPARFHPKFTSTESVIDNLSYVMNCLLESEENSKQGIAFMANMNDWTFDHFSVDYCLKFMQTLQGQRVPVRVTLFLIVNPPAWFDKVWRIMKPMLAKDFQKKVHMIPETELFEYLPFQYERYLPDDFISGKADTDELVSDFVTYRLVVEKKRRAAAKDVEWSNVVESQLQICPQRSNKVFAFFRRKKGRRKRGTQTKALLGAQPTQESAFESKSLSPSSEQQKRHSIGSHPEQPTREVLV